MLGPTFGALKEESDFRNERDVVPAAIRAGPNRRKIFFCFFGEGVSLQRDAEAESFWSFGVFLVFSCVFHGSWFRAGDCSFKKNSWSRRVTLFCTSISRALSTIRI